MTVDTREKGAGSWEQERTHDVLGELDAGTQTGVRPVLRLRGQRAVPAAAEAGRPARRDRLDPGGRELRAHRADDGRQLGPED